MSVLSDILTDLKSLLEGDSGVDRVIPSGKLTVVGTDHNWLWAQCSEDPRPCYIETLEEVDDPDAPSDVSGDYLWRARKLNVPIGYAFSPNDDILERATTIADDELTIISCLTYPLNWALTTGWAGCEVKANYEAQRDEDGVIAILYLVLSLTVSYREALS